MTIPHAARREDCRAAPRRTSANCPTIRRDGSERPSRSPGGGKKGRPREDARSAARPTHTAARPAQSPRPGGRGHRQRPTDTRLQVPFHGTFAYSGAGGRPPPSLTRRRADRRPSGGDRTSALDPTAPLLRRPSCRDLGWVVRGSGLPRSRCREGPVKRDLQLCVLPALPAASPSFRPCSALRPGLRGAAVLGCCPRVPGLALDRAGGWPPGPLAP